MEKIVIKNFLVIKEAKFEVNKINIIIGSQANGKSLVAKLLYFCKEILKTNYFNSIKDNIDIKRLEAKGEEKFKEFFPQYTWKGQKFSIKYYVDNKQWMSIGSINEDLIEIKYSKSLASFHQEMSREYCILMEQWRDSSNEDSAIGLFGVDHIFVMKQLKDNYIKNKFPDMLASSLFIPANRSIFANLQRNIFSLLNDGAVIDPFIKIFGSSYEEARRIDVLYNQVAGYKKNHKEIAKKDKEKLDIVNNIREIVEKIIVGKYVFDNELDWIKSPDGELKINLANASSGQQEALPMLLILSVIPYVKKPRRISTYFIEEPEAHLFPISQKNIVTLLSIIYKKYESRLVITTHSPYILTAINNLILAGDKIKEKGEDAVAKAVGTTNSINFEDVSAYTFKNGKMESIIDKETRLVGADIIDSVSEKFEADFDALLNL